MGIVLFALGFHGFVIGFEVGFSFRHGLSRQHILSPSGLGPSGCEQVPAEAVVKIRVSVASSVADRATANNFVVNCLFGGGDDDDISR
jgi:hypothetical protein